MVGRIVANIIVSNNANITDAIVTNTGTSTLTNKTLTSPIIATITNTGTITLPTSTDTLVSRATTDTITNKTIIGTTNTVDANNLRNGSAPKCQSNIYL